MKMQTRRHSHKSELAWKKTEEAQEVRYWFAESKTGAGDWLVVKAVDGFLVPFDWNNDTTGTSLASVNMYLDFYCDGATPLEVTASDLPYLEKPDVAKYGEMEFRKVESGKDHYIWKDNGQHGNIERSFIMNHEIDKLSGYRWCKPRKVTCPHCNGTGEIR